MPSNDNKPKKILPKIAAKPKEEEKKALPAKAVAATTGNKGAQVLEEDVGAGLSKEEAEAKVAERLIDNQYFRFLFRKIYIKIH